MKAHSEHLRRPPADPDEQGGQQLVPGPASCGPEPEAWADTGLAQDVLTDPWTSARGRRWLGPGPRAVSKPFRQARRTDDRGADRRCTWRTEMAKKSNKKSKKKGKKSKKGKKK